MDPNAQSEAPEEAAPEAARPGAVRRVLTALTGPWTRGNLLSWIVLIAAVAVLKGCLMDQYTIPSGSMEPTLLGDPRFFRGDRVLVDKTAFGLRVPFTKKWLGTWSGPERWDIVVFQSVEPDAKHPILIKRVVGLPGEEVEIRDGAVYINGEKQTPPDAGGKPVRYTSEFELDKPELKRQFLHLAKMNTPVPILNPEHPPVRALYTDMDKFHALVFDKDVDALDDAEVERLCRDVNPASLNTVKHLVRAGLPELVYGLRPEPEFRRVPEGHYLMLGDNSGQSLDGRVYGWVPRENLVGRTFAVWWPWPRRRDFTGFSGTWWGMLMLYGIPAALAAMEIAGVVRRRKNRRNAV